ncbi:unnamed protein product [Ambrosiozyma monospora]|uniref:Unnamed protein product n=1 Tax=Ambrosiozyma monospora TaxID=43982 RepID=A0A9W6YYY4_AMBMO|nr:unnamed protein product [Ambrosiozyma monospora]
MNIEDDFFAFGGSSTSPSKQQKKLKKKKKSKKKLLAKKDHTDKGHTLSNSINIDSDDNVSAVIGVKTNVSSKSRLGPSSRPNSTDDKSRKSLKKKQEEDRQLADLLGLSLDTKDDSILRGKRPVSSLYGSIGNDNEEDDDDDEDDSYIDDDFKVTRRRENATKR